MEEMVETVTTFNINSIEPIILILIGLASMFLGYRIKKIAFFVIWFFLGYQLMTFFLPTLSSWFPQIAESNLYQTLLPIVGGILLGLIGFSIEKFCVGALCFALTIAIAIQYFGVEPQTIIIAGIIGVIVSGLSIMLIKPAIIFATAIAGAYALTIAIIALFDNIDQNTFFFPILITASAIGAIIQFLTTKRLR